METCSSLFSTAYFPPVSYVAAMLESDSIVVEQYETFPKQTYRNRAVIATANGLLGLTVPVVRTNGNHTYTKDMAICYNETIFLNGEIFKKIFILCIFHLQTECTNRTNTLPFQTWFWV